MPLKRQRRHAQATSIVVTRKHTRRFKIFSPSSYLLKHSQAGIMSLGKLFRAPFASLLTLLVIAIALALPTGLWLLLKNIQAVSAEVDTHPHVSLFLQKSASAQQINELLNQLRSRKDLSVVKYISPEQGLREFQKDAGFTDVVQQLASNPLPAVIEVTPEETAFATHDFDKLVTELKHQPLVADVQADTLWVKRFAAMLTLGAHLIYALGILLAAGVLLIIGNTIRLMIQDQAEEIFVIKLIGGTHSFIRRPFLYMGIFLGLIGGLLAWLLVSLFIWSLHAPVAHLSALYSSQWQLLNLNSENALVLIFTSILLGVIGAWITVNRQLRDMEPTV